MDTNEIGKFLRLLREEKGVSREKMAIDLNTTASSVSKWEYGERVPRDEMKIAIAKYFDRPVAEIFFDH